MRNNSEQINEVKHKLNEAIIIINNYEWLLNSFILDFYLDEHWKKLPKSWVRAFNEIQPENLAELMISNPKNRKCVWPLSLLSIQCLMYKLTITRAPKLTDKNRKSVSDKNDNMVSSGCLMHPKLRTMLTKKNIKEKKRHEIEKMSELTARIAHENNIKYIVDFGAGLGHLARSLTYGYRLKVCCLEQQVILTDQAGEIDQKFDALARKFISADEMNTMERPTHLNICLQRDTDLVELVQKIKKCFQINECDNFQFGIIGLHPCGDLASILTNFFLKSREATFLNLVGCCYMKLTCMHRNDLYERKITNFKFIGYPLSDYLQDNTTKSHLSYEAREIACHANEVYAQRLSTKNYDNLRVHSFRATIERIICTYWPPLKHSGLKGIKKLTTFREYCREAVCHLGITIPENEIDAVETEENLYNWRKVVIFYSLRLMFAPLVESVILYDRVLWLMENDCNTAIEAIFDPEISSRNHIITALK